LELDTDGIWCAFPSSFPENVVLNRINGEPDVAPSLFPAPSNFSVLYFVFKRDCCELSGGDAQRDGR
jgi:hypothetical protein